MREYLGRLGQGIPDGIENSVRTGWLVNESGRLFILRINDKRPGNAYAFKVMYHKTR